MFAVRNVGKTLVTRTQGTKVRREEAGAGAAGRGVGSCGSSSGGARTGRRRAAQQVVGAARGSDGRRRGGGAGS
jgi:hypothetical protein